MERLTFRVYRAFEVSAKLQFFCGDMVFFVRFSDDAVIDNDGFAKVYYFLFNIQCGPE